MIRCHTHFSLLNGFGSPENLVKRAKELGCKYVGITDYMSVSGCVDFYSSCKKEGIKPILGCDFGDFSVLCKNKDGWNRLLGILSSDIPEIFPYSEDLILLRHSITNPSLVEWCDKENNFFVLETNLNNSDAIECRPSYYTNPEHSEMLKILISSKIKKSIPKIEKEIKSGEISEDLIPYLHFFQDRDFSVSGDTNEHLDKIAENIEEFSILSEPKLPKFQCPNGISEIEYLKDLCRNGWKKKLRLKKEEVEVYKNRVLRELDIIDKAGLAGYFLIVWDFINKAIEDGQLIGPGRGSCGGSLVSYLISITDIDPIKYELIFERFYDPSRSYPKHVSFDEYKFVDDFRTKE